MSAEAPMDPAMRDWLDDVVALVDDETGPREVLPDFAEVVARAHAIDPEVIGEPQLDEARALAPVIPLGSHLPEDLGPDAGLAAFLDDVRADGDAAAERRAMAAIPSVPAARRGSPRWASLAAAAAAILVLGVGIAGAVSALRTGGGETAVQAEYEAQPPAPSVAPAPSTGPAAPEVHEAIETDTAPGDIEVDTAAPDENEESADTEDAPPSRTRRDKTAREDRLRALDEEAQRLWRAGDIPGAQKLFREIIRVGRRGHYVQLAYGDLFNIARSGSPEDRQGLWREYLRKFPKGRHADDARGGLCRTAAASDQRACWERYLADMPRGSYRRQAMRALEQP